LTCRVSRLCRLGPLGIENAPSPLFQPLDDVVSQEELRAVSDRYRRVAGYSIEERANRVPHRPREIVAT
jgi:hypothetical protein